MALIVFCITPSILYGRDTYNELIKTESDNFHFMLKDSERSRECSHTLWLSAFNINVK